MMISKSDLGRIGLAIRGFKRSVTVMLKRNKYVSIHFSVLKFDASEIDITIDDEVVDDIKFKLFYVGKQVYAVLIDAELMKQKLKEIKEHPFKLVVEEIKEALKNAEEKKVVLVNTELATYMSGGIEPTKKVLGMLLGSKVEMYKPLYDNYHNDNVALIVDAEPWDKVKDFKLMRETKNIKIRRIKK